MYARILRSETASLRRRCRLLLTGAALAAGAWTAQAALSEPATATPARLVGVAPANDVDTCGTNVVVASDGITTRCPQPAVVTPAVPPAPVGDAPGSAPGTIGIAPHTTVDLCGLNVAVLSGSSTVTCGQRTDADAAHNPDPVATLIHVEPTTNVDLCGIGVALISGGSATDCSGTRPAVTTATGHDDTAQIGVAPHSNVSVCGVHVGVLAGSTMTDCATSSVADTDATLSEPPPGHPVAMFPDTDVDVCGVNVGVLTDEMVIDCSGIPTGQDPTAPTHHGDDVTFANVASDTDAAACGVNVGVLANTSATDCSNPDDGSNTNGTPSPGTDRPDLPGDGDEGAVSTDQTAEGGSEVAAMLNRIGDQARFSSETAPTLTRLAALPATGANSWALVLVAFALIAFGVALRRRTI